MYIFLLNLKKKIFFSFLFFKFFLFYFLLNFPTTPPLLLNVHFHIFLWFFSIRGKKFVFLFFSFFFCFSSFFLFSFLSFLLLVFLSYFLLKSSNTPILFLNFHFHLNITFQKKEEKKKKKKRERSPIFKLNSIYISKFWVFVSVFKYFISKSLTSMLNFLIFVFQYVI